MVLGIDRGLHVVADNPGVLAARCHRTRIRIGQRDLLVLALHRLALIAFRRAISSFSFAILSLSRATLASGTASALAIGVSDLRQ